MRLKLGLSKSYHDPLRLFEGKLRGAQGFVRWQRKILRSEIVILTVVLHDLNLKMKKMKVMIETREIDAYRHLSGYRYCL
jgi:hypothetical protein